MLTLYTFHNSICTQKVFITLAEKDLSYDEHLINLFAAEQFDPEYLKLNPKGVVPTLVHDGRAIPESSLICEYIDEMWPDAGSGGPLIPDDPFLKSRMRQFSKLVDEAIFEATRELSFSAMFREKMKAMPAEQREKRFTNVGDPNKRARFMSTYELGVDSPYVFQAIGNWEKAFKALDASLAEFGGPWLLGDMFTLADINIIPYLWRIEYLNLIDIWMNDRPQVADWWERAKARPSAEACIPDRLNADDIAKMGESGGKLRDAVAAKRAEYLETVPH